MAQTAPPGGVVVVGGVNVDIGGRSYGPLVAADSNPGRVRLSVGGVGRNIAHNMALLGLSVEMLTAFGDDPQGQQILRSCRELGIGISQALHLPGESTSTYVYLTDPAGEMALAVSDMEICKKIDPAYLEENLKVLEQARVVVADANIPAESIVYLAEHCHVPLFCDPVSTAKAEKLRPVLSKIHTLKPNRIEAELLTGIQIRCPEDGAQAVKALLDRGVRRVFLSMGAQGAWAGEGDRLIMIPCIPGRMVNTTGCGDAFMAALVWAYLAGLDLEGAALAGLAAASIAIESPETINSLLSAELLKQRMKERML